MAANSILFGNYADSKSIGKTPVRKKICRGTKGSQLRRERKG